MKKIKILIPVSPGGHLYTISRFKEWWSKHDRVWVSDKNISTLGFLKGQRIYQGNFPENRSLVNFFKNLIDAYNIINKERPDIIFSCGAGIAPPYFIIGKLFNIRLVYIESLSLPNQISLSGKMIYPLADLFIVQSQDQAESYPKSVFLGSPL